MEESFNKLSKISDIDFINSKESAFRDDSADKVTNATLFSRCWTVNAMNIGVGTHY